MERLLLAMLLLAACGVDSSGSGGALSPPVPVDPGPPRLYLSAVNTLWTFDPTTRAFGQDQPAGDGASCPGIRELAVDSNAHVYALGDDTNLYTLDASVTPAVCKVIGATGSFDALAFAPAGTASAEEIIVGYDTSGNYVGVDPINARPAVLRAGSLTGYTVGDLAVVGTRAYAAVEDGQCPSGQTCILEVGLADGVPIGPVVATPLYRETVALAHWGGTLFGFTRFGKAYSFSLSSPGTVDPVDVPTTPGKPLAKTSFTGGASASSAPTR